MGSFTYAHNEIIDKDEPLGTIGTTRAETGHPVGQIFGYVHDRLFTEDDFKDVENGVLKDGVPKQTFTAKVRPGDIKYVDLDKNGFIDTYDQMAIGGTENPEIVYGFGVNLRWKELDFGAMFRVLDVLGVSFLQILCRHPIKAPCIISLITIKTVGRWITKARMYSIRVPITDRMPIIARSLPGGCAI